MDFLFFKRITRAIEKGEWHHVCFFSHPEEPLYHNEPSIQVPFFFYIYLYLNMLKLELLSASRNMTEQCTLYDKEAADLTVVAQR